MYHCIQMELLMAIVLRTDKLRHRKLLLSVSSYHFRTILNNQWCWQFNFVYMAVFLNQNKEMFSCITLLKPNPAVLQHCTE